MTNEVIIPQIETAISETELSQDSADSIRAGFEPHFTEFAALAEQAKSVAHDDPKAARDLRLELKRVRVAAERVRKELKADSLRRGKAIDGINNILLHSLKPIENAMEDIEKAEARRIEAERAERLEKRRSTISQFTDPAFFNFDEMSEEDFGRLVEEQRAIHAAKLRAEQEEKKRQEAERVRLEQEAEKKRIEQERIRKEQEAEIARLRKEREEQEAAAAKEREEQEARLAAERAQAERVRKEAEDEAAKERAKREAAEAKIRKEREETERKKREEDAEKARIAAEEAKERHKAETAPDREKILSLASSVRAMELPTIRTHQGLVVQIAQRVESLASWLEQMAEDL